MLLVTTNRVCAHCDAGAYFVLVFLCILLHLMLILMVEKLSLMSRRHRLIQVGRPATWSTVRLVGYSGYVLMIGVRHSYRLT